MQRVWLREGNLPGSTTAVRPENLPFTLQYPLWSDGTRKRRWLCLPPDSTIDASRPDAWEFPRGTRVWKEFAHERTIETRCRHLSRGRAILPPMPIPVYNNFTDQDLEAIYRYLRTIPSIKNRVPEPWAPTSAAAGAQQ